jgi:hypothetical protein
LSITSPPVPASLPLGGVELEGRPTAQNGGHQNGGRRLDIARRDLGVTHRRRPNRRIRRTRHDPGEECVLQPGSRHGLGDKAAIVAPRPGGNGPSEGSSGPPGGRAAPTHSVRVTGERPMSAPRLQHERRAAPPQWRVVEASRRRCGHGTAHSRGLVQSSRARRRRSSHVRRPAFRTRHGRFLRSRHEPCGTALLACDG